MMNVARLNFQHLPIILFISLLFAQAEKVGKRKPRSGLKTKYSFVETLYEVAFAQLQLSANQPILINPRKGGIRIQNAIL